MTRQRQVKMKIEGATVGEDFPEGFTYSWQQRRW